MTLELKMLFKALRERPSSQPISPLSLLLTSARFFAFWNNNLLIKESGFIGKQSDLLSRLFSESPAHDEPLSRALATESFCERWRDRLGLLWGDTWPFGVTKSCRLTKTCVTTFPATVSPLVPPPMSLLLLLLCVTFSFVCFFFSFFFFFKLFFNCNPESLFNGFVEIIGLILLWKYKKKKKKYIYIYIYITI